MVAFSAAATETPIRIDNTTLTLFDPDTRELLRTRPSPFTYAKAARLRGA
jgi:hypothetical protein